MGDAGTRHLVSSFREWRAEERRSVIAIIFFRRRTLATGCSRVPQREVIGNCRMQRILERETALLTF